MRPVAAYVVLSVVCLCVSLRVLGTTWVVQNGWTDRDAVRGRRAWAKATVYQRRHIGAGWRIRCIDRCGGDAGCLFHYSSSLLLATHTPQTYYDYIHKKTFEACFNLVICFIFVQVTEFRSAGSPYSFCSIIFDRNADKQGHFQSSLGPHVTACW